MLQEEALDAHYILFSFNNYFSSPDCLGWILVRANAGLLVWTNSARPRGVVEPYTALTLHLPVPRHQEGLICQWWVLWA